MLACRSLEDSLLPPSHRRYLSDRPRDAAALVDAARRYVSRKRAPELAWLRRKPYDADPGNAQFYDELYSVMNLLRAAELPAGGTVLEVGCGPGWVTEILLLLGFAVEAIEPSEEMIAIAGERVRATVAHHRIEAPPEVHFHATTLEQCSLPDAGVDAVLFHAALHHVIDEHRGLANAFRMLRAGGVVAIGEFAWLPGDDALEAELEAEMRRYGTLENPFTQEYLDELLCDAGFVDVQRFHGINGLFPRELGAVPLAALATAPAAATNNVVARKPRPRGATVADGGRTRAVIRVFDSERRRGSNELRIHAEVENVGETVWEAGRGRGAVAVGLRGVGRDETVEAEPRHWLQRSVAPGRRASLELRYLLPDDAEDRPWQLDLVAEDMFWFSARGGTQPAPIELPDPRQARAAIELLEAAREGRRVRLRARLTNQGDTPWIATPGARYWTTVAVRGPRTDGPEARRRLALPGPVVPGSTVELAATFELPEELAGAALFLDLVEEGNFWFADAGSEPAPLPPPEA